MDLTISPTREEHRLFEITGTGNPAGPPFSDDSSVMIIDRVPT